VTDGIEGLLAAILRGVPRLPGALCRDRGTLFTDHEGLDTAEREYVIDRAAALCDECPCLWDCAAWSSKEKLTGVVAGALVGETARRSA
jgi:hypothetical protein